MAIIQKNIKKILNSGINHFSFVIIVLFILGMILYLHNYSVFPVTRGLDSHDYIAYIEYLVKTGYLPKADEGLQMYQPPLYFIISAILFKVGQFFNLKEPLKLVQLISLFSSLGNVFLIYKIAKDFFKSREIRYLILIFSLFLPMQVYEASVVSNEMLLSFLSSLALYFFLSKKWQKLNIKNSLLLGMIAGLGSLTKYSGLILVISISIFFLGKFIWQKEKKHLFNFLAFLISSLVVCGWFYIRQYSLFNNPLILSNDPKLFPYFQEPGYRDVNFYISTYGLYPLSVFGAQMKSFWFGTYNSIWVDSHHTFLPIIEFSRAGALIIYMGLLPMGIFLWGFFDRVKKVFWTEFKDKTSLLVIFSLLSFASYVWYTYKLPFGSSVKAFYLLTNILPASVFFGFGLNFLIKLTKRYRYVVYFEFLGLILLIFKLYWYLSWWKNINE